MGDQCTRAVNLALSLRRLSTPTPTSSLFHQTSTVVAFASDNCGRHRYALCDNLVIILSALYCKILVVLGIAFPVTEVLSEAVPIAYYKGFYLYLYLGSIGFMCCMYATLLKDRGLHGIVNSYNPSEEDCLFHQTSFLVPVVRYGSFYLRLGAVAFGIGSMVYSGLEFGQYFELKEDSQCHNMLQAFNPLTRMVLTLLQMQFIFHNTKSMKMPDYNVAARFGLMHMIACNLCEWLYVLVEETRHEIIHLHDVDINKGINITHDKEVLVMNHDCRRSNIIGHLVQNASPFLFPCTVEYSLICAVILYEMWKNVRSPTKHERRSLKEENRNLNESQRSKVSEPNSEALNTNPEYELLHFTGKARSHHHFSVDCSNAHKGLFAGIFILVLTIISLVLFLVLKKDSEYQKVAMFELNVCETTIYLICTIVVVICMIQMRDLPYQKTEDNTSKRSLGLDNTLLLIAQIGLYIYCMFSIIGCYFSNESNLVLVAELFSLVQTTCQTVFVLDTWRRRCRTSLVARRKPGRQIVTFLIVANMSMWGINTLEKGHATFRPSHLEFFGIWAWTIITHVSMPLAIFYRFHSTICLFEIWKSVYKFKPQY